MSTVCDNCIQNVPLDLFLPLEAWGSYPRGLAWFTGVEVFKGENAVAELDASRRKGCPLCQIMWTALEAAEPVWATSDFKGTGHRQLLHAPREHPVKEQYKPGIKVMVTVEGEMKITDGRRTSGAYWELKSKGYGKARAALRERADCDENFDMIKDWLRQCTESHDPCSKHQGDETFLPTRLVDIGPGGSEAPLQPRLVVSSSLDPTTPYFALSYCWGTDRGKTVQKTTRDNLPLHLEAIEAANLNKTFTDSMKVIRKLGFRYIWIDALCIIQDDRSDFEVECRQMNQIYSRACCTIVAADSPDGDGGCFIPRDTEGVKAVTYHAINKWIPYYPDGIMDVLRGRFKTDPESADVTIYPNFGPWIKSINQGPVFRRGWCLQEREMSPRVLYFTKSRILWECRESNASEDAPELVSKAVKNLELGSHLSSARLFDDQNVTAKLRTKGGATYEASKWQRLVEAYSHRKLSVAADKLPAISGLAATLALRQPDDTYLAGVWRGDLLKGISWIPTMWTEHLPADGPDADATISSLQTLSITKNESEIITVDKWPSESVHPSIPSWSWAAHDGAIRFCGESWYSGSWITIMGDDGEEKWIKSKIEVDIELASVNHAGKDPFGRVQGGELVLTGWVADVELSEDRLREESEMTDTFKAKCYAGPNGASLTMYFDKNVRELPDVSVMLLQLGTGKNVRGTDLKSDCGLVLVSSKTQLHRRVGMFDVIGDKEMWHSLRRKGTVRIV